MDGEQKDPNTAFLIELVGGFFGLLGLGHFYVGNTNDGLVRLIVWIIYEIIALVVISILLALIIGIICIPIQFVIHLGVPIWSAMSLKKDLESQALM